jgi:peroxiredoxin
MTKVMINKIRQMKYHLCFALFMLLGVVSLEAFSQSPHKNMGYKVGDVVANFTLKDSEGELRNLNAYQQSKGIIVIFTSQHCPFARAYEDRILALSNKFTPLGFPLIAINPSDPAIHQDDAMEKIKDRVKAKGFPFPYLIDPNQIVAKAFGASRTPQAYILLRNGSKFTVQYVGMIDDNPQDGSSVLKLYVDDAVTNLLARKPVVITSIKPIGCVIKMQ